MHLHIYFIQLLRSDINFERTVSGIFDAKNDCRPQKIRVFGRSGGGCPKTQKSILKVEDSSQYITTNNNKVVQGNDFMLHSDTKVGNDDQQKLVFGQSVGGDNKGDTVKKQTT